MRIPWSRRMRAEKRKAALRRVWPKQPRAVRFLPLVVGQTASGKAAAAELLRNALPRHTYVLWPEQGQVRPDPCRDGGRGCLLDAACQHHDACRRFPMVGAKIRRAIAGIRAQDSLELVRAVKGIRPQQGWELGSPADYLESVMLGICPMICPDHRRHCDAYGDGRERNLGHTDQHACSNCDGWRPR